MAATSLEKTCLVVISLALLAGGAPADRGAIPLHRLDTAPLIDGDLSDWPQEMPSISMPTDCGRLGMRAAGSDDLSAVFKVGFDDDFLYVAGVVTDDKHNAPMGLSMWHRDHLRIAVDPRNEKTLGGLGADDSELAFALLNDGTTTVAVTQSPNSVAEKGDVHFASRRAGNQTTYELALGRRALKVAAVGESAVIGFNVVVTDNDGLGRKNWLELAPGLVPADGMERDASQYATAGKTSDGLTSQDVAAPPTAGQVGEQFENLRSKLAQAVSLAAEAEKAGIATDYERVVTATAQEFIEYGVQDLNAGMVEKSNHVAQVLDDALDDATARLRSYLSGDARPLVAPRYVTGQTELRDGQFWADTVIPSTGVKQRRPVFFMGYGFFAKAIADIPKFQALGCNIIQSAREMGAGATVVAEGKVSDHLAIPSVESGAKNNVMVDLLAGLEYFPHWFRNKWPELEGAGGAFYDIKVDAPQARELLKTHLEACLKVIGDSPALLSLCLMNEPTSEHWTKDQVKISLYREYLKRVHGTIENVNVLEGANYKSFDEVPVHSTETMPPDEEMTPLRYDQVRFNMDQFAEFHRCMSDVIHKARPGTLTHTKMMAVLDRDVLHFGTDPDQFSYIGDLNGNDPWNKFVGFGDRYATLWWRQDLFYDLQRSLRPVPIINSENHIISANDPREIPREHTDCVLWQGAIHGMGASINWVWEHYYPQVQVENPPDYYGSDTFNAILTRPENVMAVGRVGLDLMRLAPEVYRMQAATSPVAIMYGITSQIWSERAHGATMRAYEAMSFNGLPVVFVSERQIREGDLSKFRAAVLPSIRHVPDDVAQAVEAYSDKGGHLWIIGDQAEALSLDQYARPRQVALSAGSTVTWPEDATAMELRALLRKAMADLGVERPVVLKDVTGHEPCAIDYRSVPDGDGYLLSMANYWGTAQQVSIFVEGRPPTRLMDLRQEQTIERSTITLKPLQALFLRVE